MRPRQVPSAGAARAPSCWGHSKGPRPGHLYQGEGSGAFICQPHQELVRPPRKYTSCTFPTGLGRREPDLPLQACCPERAQEGPCGTRALPWPQPPPHPRPPRRGPNPHPGRGGGAGAPPPEGGSPGTWAVRAGLAPSTGRWIQPPLPDR